MKTIKKLILLISIPILITGCAAMIAETCTPNAAYNEGFNDGQNNRDMQTNYASICPIEQQAPLNAAYRSGYRQGIKNPKIIIPPPRPKPRRHHFQPSPILEKRTFNAGPLMAQWDADQKCPGICKSHNGKWTGQWWTTQVAVMSVCECEIRPFLR